MRQHSASNTADSTSIEIMYRLLQVTQRSEDPTSGAQRSPAPMSSAQARRLHPLLQGSKGSVESEGLHLVQDQVEAQHVGSQAIGGRTQVQVQNRASGRTSGSPGTGGGATSVQQTSKAARCATSGAASGAAQRCQATLTITQHLFE